MEDVKVMARDNFAVVSALRRFKIVALAAPGFSSPPGDDSAAVESESSGEENAGGRAEDAEEKQRQRQRQRRERVNAKLPVSPELTLPISARPSASRFTASLWCLHSSTKYAAEISFVDQVGRGSSESSVKVHFTTAPCAFGDLPHLVTPLHIMSTGFLDCVRAQPTSWMLLLLPGPQDSSQCAALFDKLFYDAVFALPSVETPGLYLLPNGLQRYCIDLRPPDADAGTKHMKRRTWLHSRKLKHALKHDSLFVMINRNLRESLDLAKRYHESHSDGTWITPEFIDIMATLNSSAEVGQVEGRRGGNGRARVRLMAVELWRDVGSATEVDQPHVRSELLATILGFELGTVFHDYTMFTSKRCRNSFGSMLTKILGHALERSGHTLWYWGNRVAYFSQFEPHAERCGYGAVELQRDEFYRRWCAGRDAQPYDSSSGPQVSPSTEKDTPAPPPVHHQEEAASTPALASASPLVCAGGLRDVETLFAAGEGLVPLRTHLPMRAA